MTDEQQDLLDRSMSRLIEIMIFIDEYEPYGNIQLINLLNEASKKLEEVKKLLPEAAEEYYEDLKAEGPDREKDLDD